jgi:hypothetical protein
VSALWVFLLSNCKNNAQKQIHDCAWHFLISEVAHHPYSCSKGFDAADFLLQRILKALYIPLHLLFFNAEILLPLSFMQHS